MIQLTNTTPQTIAVGQSVTFDSVIRRTGCAENHRAGSGIVNLTTGGSYDIFFSANVSGATAGTPVQLNISLSGEALPEATMISTPSAADALNNVATETSVGGCRPFSSAITVTNTGTTPVTVQNPNLKIRRYC